jgi:thiamine-phosphate pyrophosphorylase
MMLPRFYAIVDAEVLAQGGIALGDFARELRDAGVTLVQYRDKVGSPQEVLRAAAALREAMAGSGCRLIMNDRADLAVLAGFDGVHVGQGDLSPEDARAVLRGADPTHRVKQERDEWGTQIIGAAGERATHPFAKDAKGWATQVSGSAIVGVSTHTDEQVVAADPMSQNRDMGHPSAVDYIAIGPVFATGTKADAEKVVGLEGVRRARALTRKPLVAIGGITRENARSVIEAGADSAAVISGLFAEGESVEKVARDFLGILR